MAPDPKHFIPLHTRKVLLRWNWSWPNCLMSRIMGPGATIFLRQLGLATFLFSWATRAVCSWQNQSHKSQPKHFQDKSHKKPISWQTQLSYSFFSFLPVIGHFMNCLGAVTFHWQIQRELNIGTNVVKHHQDIRHIKTPSVSNLLQPWFIIQ